MLEFLGRLQTIAFRQLLLSNYYLFSLIDSIVSKLFAHLLEPWWNFLKNSWWVITLTICFWSIIFKPCFAYHKSISPRHFTQLLFVSTLSILFHYICLFMIYQECTREMYFTVPLLYFVRISCCGKCTM